MIQGGVKLLAIYCFLQALMPLQQPHVLFFFRDNKSAALMLFLLPVLVFGAVGIWLWLAAPRLAASLEAGETSTPVQGIDYEHLACFMGGLVVLILNLPKLASEVTSILVTRMNAGPVVQPISPFTKLSLGATLVSVLLGLVLILGRRGLVGAVRRMRYAGLEQKQ